MTKLNLRPYRPDQDSPGRGSVPVTVLVLTKDEEVNIGRCLDSVAWADQVIVVDSGSTDDTVALAHKHGAEVVEHEWPGFAAQREFSLRMPQVRHDWVYIVDADEWVSPRLASEIADILARPAIRAAYVQRFRLVFQKRWIRHCGWYSGSWNVRLANRHRIAYTGELGERAQVDGPVAMIRNDIVDEDRKGLAEWLHKHVRYAQLETAGRAAALPLRTRIRAIMANRGLNSRPLARTVAKDLIFPALPLKPVLLFCYMYLVKGGFLDGAPGLRFCFYHAWYEATVAALSAERKAGDASVPRD